MVTLPVALLLFIPPSIGDDPLLALSGGMPEPGLSATMREGTADGGSQGSDTIQISCPNRWTCQGYNYTRLSTSVRSYYRDSNCACDHLCFLLHDCCQDVEVQLAQESAAAAAAAAGVRDVNGYTRVSAGPSGSDGSKSGRLGVVDTDNSYSWSSGERGRPAGTQDSIPIADGSLSALSGQQNAAILRQRVFQKYNLSKDSFSCVSDVTINSYNNVSLVTRCPPQSGAEEMKKLCYGDNDEDMLTRLPVSGMESGALYRNMYCAMCHQVSGALTVFQRASGAVPYVLRSVVLCHVYPGQWCCVMCTQVSGAVPCVPRSVVLCHVYPGQWCCAMCTQVSGAVPCVLRSVVLCHVYPGQWCCAMCTQVSGAVSCVLRSVVLCHVYSGQWCCAMCTQVSGAVPCVLRSVVLCHVSSGQWCCAMCPQVSGAVPCVLRSVVLCHVYPGQWCCAMCTQVSGAVSCVLRSVMLCHVSSGQWCCVMCPQVSGAVPCVLRSVVLCHVSSGQWCCAICPQVSGAVPCVLRSVVLCHVLSDQWQWTMQDVAGGLRIKPNAVIKSYISPLLLCQIIDYIVVFTHVAYLTAHLT